MDTFLFISQFIMMVVFLVMGIFGVFFLKGKIATDVEPNQWALPNTIACFVGALFMFLMFFY